jgi:hypothetical protein
MQRFVPSRHQHVDECGWFSSFFEKAFVSRVNLRMLIRMVRFWRLT